MIKSNENNNNDSIKSISSIPKLSSSSSLDLKEKEVILEKELEEKTTIFYPKTPRRGKVKISFDNQYFSVEDLTRIYPKLDKKNNKYVYYNPIKNNNDKAPTNIVNNPTISTTSTPIGNLQQIEALLNQVTSTNKTQETATSKTMRFDVDLKIFKGDIDYKELVKNYIQEHSKD
ncbi:hypothetical protein ACTFIV_009337 [Dictyostelium citrinum]